MKLRKVYLKKEKKFSRPIRVGWFSNDPQMPTGYAKVTREVCSRLHKDPRFEISCFGEGYSGAPKKPFGYFIYGIRQGSEKKDLETHMSKLNLDIIIILEDTFTMARIGIHNLNTFGKPLMLYVPMDGKWIPTTGHAPLRRANKIISMADFTHDVLKEEGFESEIIWHGVDLNLFSPVTEDEKNTIKTKFGISPNKKVLFNFGRNSLRKFNFRMIDIVCNILKQKKDWVSFLNIIHFDTLDINIPDYLDRHMTKKYGKETISRIYLNKKLAQGNNLMAVSDSEVADMMKMSDIVLSATTGEGSGLIMPEAMACMKPIITTNYSTPFEWLKDISKGIGERGVLVPIKDKVISSFCVEHGHVNEDAFVEKLLEYMDKKELQEEHRKNGRLFVERYANWDYLVEQWKQLIMREFI